VRADLAEPESGRGLIFVVLALIAGVLTLALRTPEDEVEAATGPLSVVPRADTLNDEPVTLRRRA
jgi:hypothetical protein